MMTSTLAAAPTPGVALTRDAGRAAVVPAGPAPELAGGADSAAAGPCGVPRALVAEMARSLDFYLALGCEVGLVADGWALFRCVSVSFVLLQAPGPSGGDPPPRDLSVGGPPWVRLSTPDVQALQRRLLHAGVPAGMLLHPAHSPAGEIVVLDPDRRSVAVEQPGAATPIQQLRHLGPSPACTNDGPIRRKDS